MIHKRFFNTSLNSFFRTSEYFSRKRDVEGLERMNELAFFLVHLQSLILAILKVISCILWALSHIHGASYQSILLLEDTAP